MSKFPLRSIVTNCVPNSSVRRLEISTIELWDRSSVSSELQMLKSRSEIVVSMTPCVPDLQSRCCVADVHVHDPPNEINASVGLLVGVPVGLLVGVPVGVPVGLLVGLPVGLLVGVPVGAPVGLLVGLPVGLLVGVPVGEPVGDVVGVPVGTCGVRSTTRIL